MDKKTRMGGVMQLPAMAMEVMKLPRFRIIPPDRGPVQR